MFSKGFSHSYGPLNFYNIWSMTIEARAISQQLYVGIQWHFKGCIINKKRWSYYNFFHFWTLISSYLITYDLLILLHTCIYYIEKYHSCILGIHWGASIGSSYSQTCDQQPAKGHDKTGCWSQISWLGRIGSSFVSSPNITCLLLGIVITLQLVECLYKLVFKHCYEDL